MIPTRTELARPFLPTRDFELSKRFYEALRAGDPKGRSLRGLIAGVIANDLKEAQA